MSDSLQSQLKNLHLLFADALPSDIKVITDYAWTVVKQLNANAKDVDSLTCRQLLADCIKLPIERPSKLYSALLTAAVKVADNHPEFHFATFFRMWGVKNFRPDDAQRLPSRDGKTFPSLVERTARALARSLMLHPEDRPTAEVPSDIVASGSSAGIMALLSTCNLSIRYMMVTRIKETTNKEGRRFRFVTLTSPDGLEIECVTNQLLPHPLHPLPDGKRHYVNIGQLYDCLLRVKQDASSSPMSSSSLSLKEAYLSQTAPSTIFPTEIGYLESIDQQHGHMHIYDSHSRHFVAPIQRFSRERVGDFVRFIPIIPAASKFKTAIIQGTVPSASPEVQTILREIRITSINQDRGFASWELIDKTHPITEQLSPLQLSLGETSPAFTSGYLNLAEDSSSSSSFSSSLYKAFIYLKRGKDRQKRPRVACII